MTSDWKECKLSEYIDFKNGKKRPDNPGSIPVYGGNGILNYTDETNYEECVIVGRVGAYCGSIYYSKGKCWVSDNAIVAKSKMESDIVFIYYLLKSLKLNQRSIGTGQPLLTQEILNNIEINIPPLEIQQKIARVLSAIDDKIELNNAINKNLEQQAQAIFNNTFVNLEDVPNGWQVSCLSGIAEYLNGLAMQKFRPKENEKGIPVLKIKELGQGYCNEQSDLCSPNIKSDYIINNGDVIFSWSGTLLLDIWCGGLCGLNQHLFKVTSQKFDKWFYYFWTKYHLNKFIFIAKDKATTMGHIKREDLDKSEILIILLILF